MTRRTFTAAALTATYAMSQDILSLEPPKADARIPYGTDPNQFGDLRLPSGKGPHPAGHLYSWRILARRIRPRSHRSSLCGAHPSRFRNLEPGISPCWTARRRMARHHGRRPQRRLTRAKVDQPRYGACGSLRHSAGGHLALWLAAQNAMPLRAVVPLAAVSDLKLAWTLRLSGGVVAELLGGTPEQVPDRYAKSSPMQLLPFAVPQRVIHGDADRIVALCYESRVRARISQRNAGSHQGRRSFRVNRPAFHRLADRRSQHNFIMAIVNKIFWTIAALEAAFFLVAFVMTLNTSRTCRWRQGDVSHFPDRSSVSDSRRGCR